MPPLPSLPSRTRPLLPGLLLFLLLAGCAPVTVQPPPAPEDPVTVALLDHGRHASLVLPAEQPEAWIRYSYGDWRYYVEGETGMRASLAALLLPTRAALGRQVLTGPELDGAVRTGLRVRVDELFRLEVSTARMQTLRDELEAMWEEQEDTAYMEPWRGMGFVDHPDAYTLRNNSNRVVAYWLERLDIDVSRYPVWSNWRVGRP